MSDYYDIKKLCSLSRIEIDESKFQQTSEKIKEIISFFNKLDEFELNEKEDNNAFENLPQSITTFTTTTAASSDKETKIDNYIKFEKKMNDLRNDEHNNKLTFFKDNNTNDVSTDNNSQFRFKFHNYKNGYVVGPRI